MTRKIILLLTFASIAGFFNIELSANSSYNTESSISHSLQKTNTICGVNYSYTASSGCTIEIVGLADCGIGTNFIGSVTFAGATVCPHMSKNFNFTRPDGNNITIGFVGGHYFL